MSDKIDDRTLVLAALQQAGITPSPDEIDTMVTAYPTAREATAALYTVPGVRYEDPAITFDPRPAAS
jgi:hypothetical protein